MISTEGVSKVRLGAEGAVEVEAVGWGGVGFFTGLTTSGNTSTRAEVSVGQTLFITLET